MGSNAVKQKSRKTVAIVAIVIVAAILLGGAYYVYEKLNGKGKYPLEYEDIIVKYAQENGLDPYFVAAVIYVESGFDAQAVSGAGAMGLMQIMPDTGEWIAGKLGIDAFEQSMLFDPDTNIKFGSWYLHFLNDKFEGNRQLVMAGYNAGHNRVAGWLEDKTLSDGKELKEIPFAETERYEIGRAHV